MARKPKGGDDMEMQNAAKTLMANIRFMSVDNPIRSLVFTSSIPNEGKSTVTCNVARAIASSGMRVCLVESDMRNRTLAGMLGVRSTGGLYSVLSETMPLQQAIVSTSTENMFLLDAEPHIPNPADILASKRFAALVGKLEQMFDYVIFDTPPVGMFVDAAVVSTVVDAAVLVVRENFTKRQAVVQAYEIITTLTTTSRASARRASRPPCRWIPAILRLISREQAVSTAAQQAPLASGARTMAAAEGNRRA